ncbi:MAG TPA: hypothetical protein VLC74_13795 [Rhizomicrobium sp.]|nr:hypothetical protein [Rhizomicrobium sp.]
MRRLRQLKDVLGEEETAAPIVVLLVNQRFGRNDPVLVEEVETVWTIFTIGPSKFVEVVPPLPKVWLSPKM